MKLTDRHVAQLVHEAATSNKAWNELVLAFSSQVRWAIRSHDLTPGQQEEAARATWASLAQHLGEFKDAAQVARWLTTRAHAACLEVERGSGQVDPGTAAGPVDGALPKPVRRSGPDRRRRPRPGVDRRGAIMVITGRESPDSLAARLTRREPSRVPWEPPAPEPA